MLSELGQMRIDFTRKQFDEITSKLLDKTLKLTRDVVANARERHDIESIDEVLLVGGSTFMPQVEANLRATLADLGLGDVPVTRADPHLAVAKGAAWYAHKCAIDGEVKQKIAEETGEQATAIQIENVPDSVRGEAERYVAGQRGIHLSSVKRMTEQRIRNVTAKTFGVKIATDDEGKNFEICNLILVDTEVPHEASETVKTLEPGQMVVAVECMESTSRDAECPLGRRHADRSRDTRRVRQTAAAAYTDRHPFPAVGRRAALGHRGGTQYGSRRQRGNQDRGDQQR